MSLEFLYNKPLNHAKSVYHKSMGHMKRLLGDGAGGTQPASGDKADPKDKGTQGTDGATADGTGKDGEAEKVAEKVIKASFPTGYFTDEIIENGSAG